jgi:uncharacterized membrane protein YgaE (UPF0421/DUF939 family)
VLGRPVLRLALQLALVSLCSYVVGLQFTRLFHDASAGVGALYSVISGLLVLQPTRRATWSTAWSQTLGTLAGSIVSALYLSLLPFSAIGMAVSVLATVLLCHAALRLSEWCIGAAMALIAVLVWPEPPPSDAARRCPGRPCG